MRPLYFKNELSSKDLSRYQIRDKHFFLTSKIRDKDKNKRIAPKNKKKKESDYRTIIMQDFSNKKSIHNCLS